ncbi:MAG: hypothetical protein KAV87_22145 [Desulfobacteraceae bacterium]|nr:hypothetical protein [Desulfobacteraceae bacterium]
MQGKLPFAAVLFSTAGDAALGFEPGENFTIGLEFSLVAHVLYIVTFSRDIKRKNPGSPSLSFLLPAQ